MKRKRYVIGKGSLQSHHSRLVDKNTMCVCVVRKELLTSSPNVLTVNSNVKFEPKTSKYYGTSSL